MKEKIDRRTCDYCKKIVEQSSPVFGVSPFNGWISVDRTMINTTINMNKDCGSWDFCCVEHCIQFLSSNFMCDKKSESALKTFEPLT